MGERVEFVDEGERLVVRPKGRIDATAGDDIASAVEQRLHASTRAVTIDLDALDFVSLGGIRAILRLARTLKRRATELDFIRGGDRVREALHQAGLNSLFPFTPPYVSHRGMPS